METMARREIRFRTYGGGGPKLVLVPGGPAAALVGELARTHTVHLLERWAEIDDLAAVLDETGAGNVAGIDAGAEVALRAALELPAIERLALVRDAAGHGRIWSVPWKTVGALSRLGRPQPAGRLDPHGTVTAETLLLGRGRAPAYGGVVLPRAQRVTLSGSGSSGTVAAELRKFFR